MCLHKKFYYRVIYYTLICSLIIIIVLSIIGAIGSVKFRDQYDRYAYIFPNAKNIVQIMLLVDACLIAIFSIFGLIAVLADTFPLLILCSYGLTFLSFLSFIFGFYLMAVTREIRADWGKANFYTKELSTIAKRPDFLALNSTILDPLQIDFDCCGINGYEDYQASATQFWMRGILPLPKTCCWDIYKAQCIPGTDEHKKRGCMKVFVMDTVGRLNQAGVFLVVFGGCTVGINAMYMFLLAKKAKEMWLFYPYYI